MTPQQLESIRSGRHGSFYRALGDAYAVADQENRAKLERTFGNDINVVTRMGGLGAALEAFGLLENHNSARLEILR